MLLPSRPSTADLSRYTFVRRHVGGGGIKIVLLQVSDDLVELVLICFLSFFSCRFEGGTWVVVGTRPYCYRER